MSDMCGPAVAKGSVTRAGMGSRRPADVCVRGARQLFVGDDFLAAESAGLIDDAADTERMAVEAESNGGVYLVPAFAGLSAPYSKPDARAAIVNMTAHTRKEHIVRAALESIAYQINDVLGMMGRDAGVAPRVLHADGGPTRNNFLMQFTADITGAELVVSDVPESFGVGGGDGGDGWVGCREFDRRSLRRCSAARLLFAGRWMRIVCRSWWRGWNAGGWAGDVIRGI